MEESILLRRWRIDAVGGLPLLVENMRGEPGAHGKVVLCAAFEFFLRCGPRSTLSMNAAELRCSEFQPLFCFALDRASYLHFKGLPDFFDPCLLVFASRLTPANMIWVKIRWKSGSVKRRSSSIAFLGYLLTESVLEYDVRFLHVQLLLLRKRPFVMMGYCWCSKGGRGGGGVGGCCVREVVISALRGAGKWVSQKFLNKNNEVLFLNTIRRFVLIF